jgi:hypothetical protein
LKHNTYWICIYMATYVYSIGLHIDTVEASLYTFDSSSHPFDKHKRLTTSIYVLYSDSTSLKPEVVVSILYSICEVVVSILYSICSNLLVILPLDIRYNESWDQFFRKESAILPLFFGCPISQPLS